MGSFIRGLLVLGVAGFLIYCTAVTGFKMAKEAKNKSNIKINPKDVIKVKEPIVEGFKKVVRTAKGFDVIKGTKMVGEKVTYLFKKSKKEKKLSKLGVMDRKFEKFQKGVKTARENYVRNDNK